MRLKWLVIDGANDVVLDLGWEWCLFASDDMLYFRAKGLMGLYDLRALSTVLEPRFKSVSQFSESSMVVADDTESYLIDITGRRLSRESFWIIGKFVEGIAPAKREKNSLYGFINKVGEWVVLPSFVHLQELSEGMAMAMRATGELLYVDRHGEPVIAGPFTSAYSFSEGLGAVRTNDGDFYVDRDGSVVLRGGDEWKCGGRFYGGRASVLSQKREGLVFFIDKRGAMVGDRYFEADGGYSDGLAAVKLNGRWGAIDVNGATKIPFEFDALGWHVCGKSAADLRGKYGYVDVFGNWVIPPTFSNAGEFNRGNQLACVALEGL